MTREEAIEELKYIKDGLVSCELSYVALDMAIKALEQMPSEDCVSRQAVLDALDKRFDSVPMEQTTEILLLRKDLRELPPVTPILKWIPVSERLPESSGVYIVSRWFSDGEERAILVDANYYDGDGYWYNDNRINWGRDLVTDKIVAWMPLPEPYKAEMESEE